MTNDEGMTEEAVGNKGGWKGGRAEGANDERENERALFFSFVI